MVSVFYMSLLLNYVRAFDRPLKTRENAKGFSIFIERMVQKIDCNLDITILLDFFRDKVPFTNGTLCM